MGMNVAMNDTLEGDANLLQYFFKEDNVLLGEVTLTKMVFSGGPRR